ncbi:hypothetical protein J7T55_011473 [Diaporthe amygdali]|uniref:uncharacterized protein n=1 Tax=Phomopsis amygdali TaxID=1214568 RepID=UPI0022FE775C|nr:uncharacterized protein J7T55_011473 [Diaporthe amygdali]KAJ0123011.1 hypothetical protein J7T55_011473 [Diaporthe amygdali]
MDGRVGEISQVAAMGGTLLVGKPIEAARLSPAGRVASVAGLGPEAARIRSAFTALALLSRHLFRRTAAPEANATIVPESVTSLTLDGSEFGNPQLPLFEGPNLVLSTPQQHKVQLAKSLKLLRPMSFEAAVGASAPPSAQAPSREEVSRGEASSS